MPWSWTRRRSLAKKCVLRLPLALLCLSFLLPDAAWLQLKIAAQQHRRAGYPKSCAGKLVGFSSSVCPRSWRAAMFATVSSHTVISVPSPWDKPFEAGWTVPEGAVGGSLMRSPDGDYLAVLDWASEADCDRWLNGASMEGARARTKVFHHCLGGAGGPVVQPRPAATTAADAKALLDSMPSGSSGDEPDMEEDGEVIFYGGDPTFLDDSLWDSSSKTPQGSSAGEELESDIEDDIVAAGGDPSFLDGSAWGGSSKPSQAPPPPIPNLPNRPTNQKGMDARSIFAYAMGTRVDEKEELSDEEEMEMYGGKTSAHPPSRRADAVFAKLAGVSPITSSGSKVTTPTALPAPPLSSRSTSKTAPRRVVPSWRRASTTTWGAAGDPALISSPAARSSLDLCGDLDGRVMLFEPVPPAERARPVQESPAQEVEEVHEQPPETCASGELVRTGLIHSDAKFVHDGERHMMSNLAPSTTQADVAIVEEISDDDQAEPAAVPPASASVPDTTLPCIGMDSGTSAKLSEQVVEAEDATALDVQDTQQDDDAWEAPTERDVWVAALCLCPCDIADVPQAYLSDRNVALAALARNGEGLMYVAQSLRKDREVVQAAVNQSGKCLRLANPEFQSDKEIVLAAVRHNGEALDCAARELRHDREVAFAAVGQNWRALSHVGKELRQDHELVRLACAQNGEALCYAAEELRADAELVRTAVGTNGRILRFVADALKGDRHVVLRAVGQDGMALQFAIEDLRGDREVVFEAVAQTGLAVSYVSEALRGDKALALVAVRQNGLALARLAKELQTDRDVVLAAVAQNGDALGSASEGLRRDREVVLDAVSQCGTSLRFAAKELQGDAKIVVAAATQNPGAMEYAAKDLFSNRQVMLAAVQKDWRYLQRATLEIKHDREVVRAAIRQNVLAFWAAPRELQADWDMVCAAFGEDGADVWFATGQILGEREAVLTAAGAKGREFRGAGGGLPGEWRKVLTTLGENWQAVESALDARPSSFLGA